MKSAPTIFSFLLAFSLLLLTSSVSATDLTSPNFIIRDPVIGTGGGHGASSSYELFSSGNPGVNATGSSANFLANYGFLYFPSVTDVELNVVPSSADAVLSWSAADATEGLGWVVAGYTAGISSVSGGPYTYIDVGNVTGYTYENLAPGAYCFILQTYDALNNVIASSDEECITIQAVMVFDIDTSVADGETNTPYSVALGAITTSDTRVSGSTDSINMIIIEGTTNASSGLVVTVRNVNGNDGLVSSSTAADTVDSTDGTIADGTENYGLCVMTASLSGFSRAAPYNSGSCALNSETNVIQGLTTTGENILSAPGSVIDAHAEIAVNAAISPGTSAHSDYADTLTFIVTPTF